MIKHISGNPTGICHFISEVAQNDHYYLLPHSNDSYAYSYKAIVCFFPSLPFSNYFHLHVFWRYFFAYVQLKESQRFHFTPAFSSYLVEISVVCLLHHKVPILASGWGLFRFRNYQIHYSDYPRYCSDRLSIIFSFFNLMTYFLSNNGQSLPISTPCVKVVTDIAICNLRKNAKMSANFSQINILISVVRVAYLSRHSIIFLFSIHYFIPFWSGDEITSASGCELRIETKTPILTCLILIILFLPRIQICFFNWKFSLRFQQNFRPFLFLL